MDLTFIDEDDDEHGSRDANETDSVSPKEAGHNIFILAHQVGLHFVQHTHIPYHISYFKFTFNFNVSFLI